jgi:hypothetical protein
VDLFSELGMRNVGDQRKWKYTFNQGGKLIVTFIAMKDLAFPTYNMKAIVGSPRNLSLPYSKYPEVELTIYQCANLYSNQSSSLQGRLFLDVNIKFLLFKLFLLCFHYS